MYPSYQSYNFQNGLMGGVPYGTLTLTETSPPQSFAEPFSVNEAAKFLKLSSMDLADQGDVDELQGLITAAREEAEIAQGRDLVRKQWDLRADFWPAFGPIQLRPHLVSVDLFQYTDSDNVDHSITDYIIDTGKQPGVIMPPYNQPWPAFIPRPSSGILVRFTAGLSSSSAFWSDAGARVKIGMKYLISAWYTNRIPFTPGISSVNEYPMSVTSCLSHGRVESVR